MDTIKKILILSGFTIIFLFGTAANHQFADQDSYYWLQLLGIPETHFLFVKIYLALLLFGCMVAIWKTGELLNKENGWWAALILFGGTLFITDFYKFENDSLGFLLGFIGIYFAIAHWKSKKVLDVICSGVFFIFAGVIWHGAIYWLFASIFFAPLLLFLFMISFAVYGEAFFNFLNVPETVTEQKKLIGLIYYGPSMVFLVGVFFVEWPLIFAFITMLFLGLYEAKLYVLGIPFFVLIVVSLLSRLALKFDKRALIENVLIVFCFFMAIIYAINAGGGFPDKTDIALVKQVVPISPIQNEFSAGHILTYYGGRGTCTFGGLCDFNYLGWVLDIRDKNVPASCQVISSSNHLSLLLCQHYPL